MAKKYTPPPEPATRVIETFRKIGQYELGNLTSDEPSCFNGRVSIHRYRVTVEKLEEPDEVLKERIQKLWDECDNSHHWGPLQDAAKGLGLKLDFKTQTRNR
jgi:hypothetical protein